jgi:PAS domain-containing protein
MAQTLKFPDGETQFETIFEEFPLAAFVFDEEVRIKDFNRAAFRLMNVASAEVERLLFGNAVGCVHASEPGGCGTTLDCKECVVINSVEATFIGDQGVRAKGRITVNRGNVTASEEYVVATAMLPVGEHGSVLLTLQAVSDFGLGSSPICIAASV